jgi:hypothetical protein
MEPAGVIAPWPDPLQDRITAEEEACLCRREIVRKKSDKKAEIVEIDDENGDVIEPPPPEVVEPDPEMTPEEAEALRKGYLLTRFWISARGFWGRHGDRLAWPFSIGLLILIVGNVALQYGINVWNRAIFDGIEKRDAATVYFLTAYSFRWRSAVCWSASRRCMPHGYPTPLARPG